MRTDSCGLSPNVAGLIGLDIHTRQHGTPPAIRKSIYHPFADCSRLLAKGWVIAAEPSLRVL